MFTIWKNPLYIFKPFHLIFIKKEDELYQDKETTFILILANENELKFIKYSSATL